MGDKNFKEIRKQLRNVVKEILPEVLANEAVAAINKQVNAKLEDQLGQISKNVKTTLETIDTRAKDIQNFVLRTAAASSAITPNAPVPTEALPAVETAEQK